MIRIDADSDEVTGWNGADFSYEFQNFSFIRLSIVRNYSS
jgi:hypothetical protein